MIDPAHVLQGVDERAVALVNEYGQRFQPVPWSTWRGRNYRRRKAGKCFYNAWIYATRTQGLTADPRYPDALRYVEGFANFGVGWIAHAWCVDDRGRVVDPTWCEEDNQEWDYFGIPLDLALVAGLQLSHMCDYSFMVITRPTLHDAIRAWLLDGTIADARVLLDLRSDTA